MLYVDLFNSPFSLLQVFSKHLEYFSALSEMDFIFYFYIFPQTEIRFKAEQMVEI